MSSLIISSASRSSPHILIYHSSHNILIPSSTHSIILAFFTFPLIHFTIVLFAISSKLIFIHFIYHTLLFIFPSSFPSYFTSITLITTHPCFSFPFASMISIHSYASIPILIPLLSILYIPFISFLCYSSTCLNYEIYTMFVRILLIPLSSVVLIENTLSQLDVLAFVSDV